MIGDQLSSGAQKPLKTCFETCNLTKKYEVKKRDKENSSTADPYQWTV